MEFTWTLTFDGILVIFATLLSPVIALLVADKREKKRFQKDRQLDIFRTLMKGPVNLHILDKEFVSALNLVYVEFSSCQKVMQARQELQKLITQGVPQEQFFTEEFRIAVARLLREMATLLGIKVSEIDILYGLYSPRAWDNELNKRAMVDDALLRVLNGQQSINVNPTSSYEANNTFSDDTEET